MDSIKEAARILVTHFRLVAGITEEEVLETVEEEQGVPDSVYDAPIDELGLSVRVFNALKRAGISKVGEVLDMLQEGENAILRIRNFGDKSLTELQERLEELEYLEYLEDDEEEA
jgi:DNA-directed RNA polymerase subunit alpha